uniref:Uncharacterized protein n=1 Tax=Phlebia radiata TaxID=5308 RepID=L8B9H2_PHLRA|nr:hypothetical protein Pra_mt0304 [Phlebia radiata]CCF07372.1 hypothetical protein Pra_mt0304 [Phlebia radiata]
MVKQNIFFLDTILALRQKRLQKSNFLIFNWRSLLCCIAANTLLLDLSSRERRIGNI